MNRPDAVDLVARVQGVWPDKWTPGRVEQWIDAKGSLPLEWGVIVTWTLLGIGVIVCPSQLAGKVRTMSNQTRSGTSPRPTASNAPRRASVYSTP